MVVTVAITMYLNIRNWSKNGVSKLNGVAFKSLGNQLYEFPTVSVKRSIKLIRWFCLGFNSNKKRE